MNVAKVRKALEKYLLCSQCGGTGKRNHTTGVMLEGGGRLIANYGCTACHATGQSVVTPLESAFVAEGLEVCAEYEARRIPVVWAVSSLDLIAAILTRAGLMEVEK